MRHLILGAGEVGSAIGDVLQVGDLHDPDKGIFIQDRCQFLHVCFPYSKSFNRAVREYQDQFRPMITVIHSTVPISTSEFLNAVHSPVRGKHPHLAESIRTFTKYFGGPGADIAAEPFASKGVDCVILENSRDTEALKLWDTAQYGWMILLEKEIHRWCEANGCDFDIVYRLANETYNSGFAAMKEDYQRPTLKHMSGPIGGHCVIPNAELLDSWIAAVLVAQNDLLKRKWAPTAP